MPLLCGFGLSSERLVVDRLELYRVDRPEGPVETPVVVPGHPVGRRELDFLEGAVGAGVPDDGADAFGLEQGVHCLRECVIVGPRRFP